MLSERRGVFKGPILVVNITVCVSELHRNQTRPSSTAFVWLSFQKACDETHIHFGNVKQAWSAFFFGTVRESHSHIYIWIYFAYLYYSLRIALSSCGTGQSPKMWARLSLRIRKPKVCSSNPINDTFIQKNTCILMIIILGNKQMLHMNAHMTLRVAATVKRHRPHSASRRMQSAVLLWAWEANRGRHPQANPGKNKLGTGFKSVPTSTAGWVRCV